MNIVIIALLALIAFATGAFSVYLIMRGQNETRTRLTLLEADIAEEKRKREAVESVGGRKNHYTYNMWALANDIKANISACEFELIELKGRLETINKQADYIIHDPSKYDPEKPGKDQ
jgi:hypothetical protein